MIRIQELRERLISYIANEISFADFEDWLIDRSWDMHKDSTVEAQELVHSINASIFKYLDGYINERSLKIELVALLKDQTADLIVSDTQAPIIRQSWRSAAGSQFAQAHAVG
jgi:hypothetical protein